MRRQRQDLGHRLAVQRNEHVGRRLIAFRDRPRRVALDEAHAAEILDDQETAFELGMVDPRRREPSRAQPPCDRDEGFDVFGEMHGGAVGFAVIDRGPIRPPRRIHQDESSIVADQAGIGADRGVAGHAPPRGLAKARLAQELPQRPEPFDSCRGLAVAGDFRRSRGRAQSGAMIERDIDAVGAERAARALRPFDQGHCALGQWRQTDLFQFACIADPVEVGVKQRKRRQVVSLHQREGRAWNFERVVVGEITDHRARGRGLSGTEIARQRDDIAGADQKRQISHQLCGRGLVGQRDRKCRPRRHSAALRCAV